MLLDIPPICTGHVWDSDEYDYFSSGVPRDIRGFSYQLVLGGVVMV